MDFDDELERLVQIYLRRVRLCEDVNILEEFGGEEALLGYLNTSAERGIGRTTHAERAKRFGINSQGKDLLKPKFKVAEIFKGMRHDYSFLLAAALTSILVKSIVESDYRIFGWVEGATIIICAIIGSVFQAIINWKEEVKTVEFRINQTDTRVQVIREGIPQEVPRKDLVVGDLIMINILKTLDVDVLVTEANNLGVDESHITGEIDTCYKASYKECIKAREKIQEEGRTSIASIHEVPSPIFVSGSTVLFGSGKGIVLATGTKSTVGKLERSLIEPPSLDTPLQSRMQNATSCLNVIVLILAGLIILGKAVIVFIRWKTLKELLSHGSQEWLIIEGILCGFALIAVAIPESISLAVPTILNSSLPKMLEEGLLVQKVTAIEAAAEMDALIVSKQYELVEDYLEIDYLWNKEEIDFKETKEEWVRRSQKNMIQLECLSESREDMEEEFSSVKNPPNTLNYKFFVSPICRQLFVTSLFEPGMTTEDRLTDSISRSVLRYLIECGFEEDHFIETSLSPSTFSCKQIVINEPLTKKDPVCDKPCYGSIVKCEVGEIFLVRGPVDAVLPNCSGIINLSSGELEELQETPALSLENPLRNSSSRRMSRGEKNKLAQEIQTKWIQYEKVSTAYAYKWIKKKPKEAQTLESRRTKPEEDSLLEHIEKFFPGEASTDQDEPHMSNLNLTCCLAMSSPLKQSVKKTINKFNETNISIVMTTTGHSVDSARMLAKQAGILPEDQWDEIPGSVVSGPELEEVSGGTKTLDEVSTRAPLKNTATIVNKEAFNNMFKKIALLWDCSSAQRHTFLVGLEENQFKAGFICHSCSDLVCSSRAYLCFAYKHSTESAKQHAGIILLDETFSSVITAAKWGKHVYACIRKTFQFELIMTVTLCLFVTASNLALQESILSASQLLFLRLLIDLLNHFFLSTDRPTKDLLGAKTIDKKAFIVTQKMAKHIVGQAIYQFCVVTTLLLAGPRLLTDHKTTDSSMVNLETLEGGQIKKFVRSGIWSFGEKRWPALNSQEPSRHFTYIFATIGLMNIFTYMSCRTIEDQFCCLSSIFSIKSCLACLFSIASIVAVTQFGSISFRVAHGGLDFHGWVLVFSLSAGCLVWSLFLRALKEEECPAFCRKEDPNENKSRWMGNRYLMMIQKKNKDKYRIGDRAIV